jgi:hypothetical protein
MPKAEKLKKNGLDTTALPEFPYCFGEEGENDLGVESGGGRKEIERTI